MLQETTGVDELNNFIDTKRNKRTLFLATHYN